MPGVWLFIRHTSTSDVPDTDKRYRGEVNTIYNLAELPEGCGELDTNIFLRYHMTDLNGGEVASYLDVWNRDVVFEVVNGPDPDGYRRIKSTNQRTNSNLNIGGWTQEQADAITQEWNADPELNLLYPDENLVTVGFTDKDLIQEGRFTPGQAAAYQALVRSRGEDYQDRHKLWRLSEQACVDFESTGGVKTGTFNQLSQFLVYGPEATE